jgi:Stress responsive A/B Barrel Domain
MTVRHVVVFRWRPDVTAEDIAAIDDALAALPGQVPSLRAYHHGADLQLGEGRWDYGIVAECDDVEGFRAYESHPAHQRVVVDVIRPCVAERAAVQIGR